MNIHIICDSPKTMSGFSNVGRHLAIELTKLGHGVSMTGLQTHYESEVMNNYEDDIEIMPSYVQYIDDITQIMLNIQKTEADVVICIFNGDDSQQNQIAVQTSMITKVLWYVPVEGKNISDLMVRDLSTVSQNGKIIAQCNWGYNEMKKKGVESTVIYHGYDPEVFKKLDKSPPRNGEKINMLRYSEIDSKWTTNQVYNDNLKYQFRGKFVFGFVGANHGVRKRIERLLTAYSLFLKDNKKRQNETLLLMRTMPISVTGIDLIRMCSDLGISQNVVFLYGENNRLSDESVNVIYNCFDVNVSTSSSEGFGLPTLETMTIGVPQIGPSCSSFVELIDNKRGILVVQGEWQIIPDMSYRFLVNEHSFSLAMKYMYERSEERNKFGKNAAEWSKQYTWEKVAKEWNSLIEKCEKN